MNLINNSTIPFCKKKMEEACKGLTNLKLKNMTMYAVFNDGNNCVLPGFFDNENSYCNDMLKAINFADQQDHYLFEKPITNNANKSPPIFNIIRHHDEGVFVFTSFGDWPKDTVQIFYEKTVKKFETFCIHFMDVFSEDLRRSGSSFRFSFVLNNKWLRDAIIRQGYEEKKWLTEREQECLLHAGLGRSAKEIARMLDISANTVEWHLKRIRKLFGNNKLPEIMLECLHRGVFGKPNFLLKNQMNLLSSKKIKAA